jgi:prepilin-type N-terminal cleavage/methylation domain-containing protein
MKQRKRAGFTLVEMLVVIGIIVLLVGILLPTIMSARRNAEKNAVRMELHTIALALDAYKADFGDYPRPPNGASRKYRLLAWALMGPYDGGPVGGVTDPLSTPTANAPLVDGADGPGFRTSWDNVAKKGSKVWGPYLAPEKFRVATQAVNLDFPTTPVDLRWDILDRYGSPIEYFPRWRNYQTGMNLFGTSVPAPPATPNAVYDFQQQWQKDPTGGANAQAPVIKYLRRALGDDYIGKDQATGNPGTPPNDVIDAKESFLEAPPFLLVSQGSLRSYPSDADMSFKFEKCEVITNLQH